MIAAVLNLRDKNQCHPFATGILNWFVLPFFCFCIFIAYTVSSLSLMIGPANGDFCSGGKTMTPDETILEIWQILVQKHDSCAARALSLALDVAQYYVGQCRSADPFSFFWEMQGMVGAILPVVEEVMMELEDIKTEIQEICQMPNLFQNLENISQTLQDLVPYLEDAIRIWKCESITALYSDLIYDGFCTLSVSAMSWAYFSLFTVALMGLSMILLRSSIMRQKNMRNDDDNNDFMDDTSLSANNDTTTHDISKEQPEQKPHSASCYEDEEEAKEEKEGYYMSQASSHLVTAAILGTGTWDTKLSFTSVNASWSKESWSKSKKSKNDNIANHGTILLPASASLIV